MFRKVTATPGPLSCSSRPFWPLTHAVMAASAYARASSGYPVGTGTPVGLASAVGEASTGSAAADPDAAAEGTHEAPPPRVPPSLRPSAGHGFDRSCYGLAGLRRGLDHAVRTRVHEALVAIGKADQIRRRAVVSAYLYDLSVAVAGAHGAPVHADAIADRGLHTSSPPTWCVPVASDFAAGGRFAPVLAACSVRAACPAAARWHSP